MFEHLCLLQDLEPDKGIHEQCMVHYWAQKQDLSACFIVLVPLKRRNKHPRNCTEVTEQQWIMHPLGGPCPGYGLWGKLGWFKDWWKNHMLNRLIEREPSTSGVILVDTQSQLKWLNTQRVWVRMKLLHYSCFPLPTSSISLTEVWTIQSKEFYSIRIAG